MKAIDDPQIEFRELINNYHFGDQIYQHGDFNVGKAVQMSSNFHYGDNVTEYGNHNVGMIKNQCRWIHETHSARSARFRFYEASSQLSTARL